MTGLPEAARQALEALETCDAAHISDGGRQWYDEKAVEAAITALRAALEAQQEPVAYLFTNVQSGFQLADCDPDWHADEREMWHRAPLYAAPQPRPGWVLVPEEPTPEMVAAALTSDRVDWIGHYEMPQSIYRAMLAARPQPKETT